jgi:hypothetical protein
MLLALEVVLAVQLWRVRRHVEETAKAAADLDVNATAFLMSVSSLVADMRAPYVDFDSPRQRHEFRDILASAAGKMPPWPDAAAGDDLRIYLRQLLERARHSPVWMSDAEDPWRPVIRLIALSDTAAISDGDGAILIQIDRISSIFVDGVILKSVDNEQFGTTATTDLPAGFHALRVETRDGAARSLKFPILERTLTAVNLTSPSH